MIRLRFTPRRQLVALATLALLSMLGFLLLSARSAGPGFPLDDAWIHQTYARNMATTGQWAFQAGQPSSGSTSPGWTALLIPGHWLGAPPVLWSSLLGWGMLVATGWVARRWLVRRGGWGPSVALPAAAVIVLEWHLVWAALSGMETLAAGALALIFFSRLEARSEDPLPLGALAGLGVWVRPDLLTLVAGGAWAWAFHRFRRPGAWRWAWRYGLGVAVLVGPYLALQWWLSGSVWPSTFYAKQAEYAVLRQLPLAARYLGQLQAPMAGGLLVLVPGIVWWSARRLRRRQWARLGPLLWGLLYLGMFAVRLPATYQHGRYAMPVIPILSVLGLEGMAAGLASLGATRGRWVLRRAWVATLALTVGAFWWLGGRGYAQDVAIIETEMVGTAHWIADNTEPAALIAAHDIGALGYFGERRLLDMAGLVSPEVIPILRDEPALEAFLNRRGADYLVTFPDWYPQLIDGRAPVFSPDAPYSPAAGGTHMNVYRW